MDGCLMSYVQWIIIIGVSMENRERAWYLFSRE